MPGVVAEAYVNTSSTEVDVLEASVYLAAGSMFDTYPFTYAPKVSQGLISAVMLSRPLYFSNPVLSMTPGLF